MRSTAVYQYAYISLTQFMSRLIHNVFICVNALNTNGENTRRTNKTTLIECDVRKCDRIACSFPVLRRIRRNVQNAAERKIADPAGNRVRAAPNACRRCVRVYRGHVHKSRTCPFRFSKQLNKKRPASALLVGRNTVTFTRGTTMARARRHGDTWSVVAPKFKNLFRANGHLLLTRQPNRSRANSVFETFGWARIGSARH